MYFYIDPGTGSMLFTVLIGLASASLYALRGFIIKIRYSIGGEKIKTVSDSIPYIIFSDNKRYWNVFEPICDEFEKRKINLTYLTLSKDDDCFKKDYKYIKTEFIGEGNKAFTKLNFLKADILISTTPGLDVYQWKRSRDVKYYVHIPHAASDISIYRMFGIDYYDSILLSGEYQKVQIRQLETLRELKEKELEIIGIPYMDEMKKRLENTIKEKKEETIVLLAPSWGKSGILSKYGTNFLDKLISSGYHIIVRPHPQSFISEKEMIDDLMKKYPESERFEWNKDSNNFDVLNRSDILISDFSGVIFDFTLVYDKPVIYADTSFDKSPYDAAWIEDELWTFKILPDLGEQLTYENMNDISLLVEKCLSNPKYKEGREKARNQTWMYRGQGTCNAVDYLINKHKELINEENN